MGSIDSRSPAHQYCRDRGLSQNGHMPEHGYLFENITCPDADEQMHFANPIQEHAAIFVPIRRSGRRA